MKKLTKGLFLSTAIVAAMLSTSASAALEPVFTVDESIQGSGGSINAQIIQGTYSEAADFDTNNGTYTISVLLDLNTYLARAADGATPSTVPSQLGASGYNLYATFLGNGTFAPIAGGTKFDFTDGAFKLYLDPLNDSQFTDLSAQSSLAEWGVGPGAGDDMVVATGNVTSGVGTLTPGLFGTACTQANICGAFGTTTTVELTNFGKTFFTAPDPFFNMSLESGTMKNFDVTAGVTQRITGDGSVFFAKVPEPATLALFGLGLAGMAGVARRKAKQA